MKSCSRDHGFQKVRHPLCRESQAAETTLCLSLQRKVWSKKPQWTSKSTKALKSSSGPANRKAPVILLEVPTHQKSTRKSPQQAAAGFFSVSAEAPGARSK